MFVYRKMDTPKTRADVPTTVLIPSFVLSELKTAFQIGFIIYLPFLVIDMVAASVLMAMGMMMLPPVVISLPFKIMLFVFVDGWGLARSARWLRVLGEERTMSEELILKLGHDTLQTTAMLATPMLLGALVIGLIVSILQAITQINEATLTFIPKMVVVAVVFVIAAPWMMDVMNNFTTQLFDGLADMVRIR